MECQRNDDVSETGVIIVTVKETSEGLIIPEEMFGIDYAPEDPSQIITIGTNKETARVILLSGKVNLGVSKEWKEKLKKTL